MEMRLDNKKRYSGYDVISFFDTQVLGLDELEKYLKKYLIIEPVTDIQKGNVEMAYAILDKIKELKTKDLRSSVTKAK